MGAAEPFCALTGPPVSVDDAHRGSLQVGEGELVVLLGPSGAGKTRWLKALVALDKTGFDRGYLFGRKISQETVASTIGWVPQGDGVFLSDTVIGNVLGPPATRSCTPRQARDALDLVALQDRAGEPVANLGLGERRRVALARALARRRPLMVVDSPLDPTLWSLFLSLRPLLEWVRGWLVADTAAGELSWRADSVAVMRDGRVIGQGPLASLLGGTDPAVREAALEVCPPDWR